MSRNFKGHFGVSEFSLYLKNGEDLSHQTVYRHFSFCYLESMLKDQLSKKQAVGSFENGFWVEKVFGTFEKTASGPVTPIDQMTSINCCKIKCHWCYGTQ